MPQRPDDLRVPSVRIGDAEREEFVTMLAEHHAHGRLSAGEFEERVAHALQSQTEAELVRLVVDLPEGSGRTADGQRRVQRFLVPDLPGHFWTRVAAPVAGVSATAYVASSVLMSQASASYVSDTALVACLVTGAAGFVTGRFGRHR